MKYLLMFMLLISVSYGDIYTKCANCHGQNGNKSAFNVTMKIGHMTKKEFVKKIKGYQDNSLNQYGMGNLMSGQVKTLTDADINSIVSHLNLK
jgi:cytochrome c553